MQNRLARFLASFFYLGFFPVAPGSLASLMGILIYFFLRRYPLFYAAVFIVITGVGFVVSDRAEKDAGKKDPSFIVIDEVSGAMIAIFMLPMNPPVVWTAYFLFRAFDMFKIYPVYKYEKISGGVGVMMDDIIAGIYTNLFMHLAVRLAGIV